MVLAYIVIVSEILGIVKRKESVGIDTIIQGAQV
jgi:hypothetical protein